LEEHIFTYNEEQMVKKLLNVFSGIKFWKTRKEIEDSILSPRWLNNWIDEGISIYNKVR
jgi:hypothetical protein